MSQSNILVVEDSGIVLLDIQKSLESLGYAVAATASSKDEAIRKADETRPDLVLMDIRLGEEMGGIEAADYIREHFNIPIVFLTGYADEDTFQRAKITDPFGYILKPFDPKGLRTTIEIALHNHDLKSQLHESEKRYRTLVETMNDGMGQVDADGKFVFVNDKLCQMTGFSKEELIGREHVFLFAEDRQKLQQEEFEKRKLGEENSFETLLVHKDSSTTPVILSGSPVFTENGEFAGTIGVFTNINERVKAEEQVRRSKQALEEAERRVHLGHFEIDVLTGDAVWSEEIFNIFGRNPNLYQPTVESYSELIHPEDVAKVVDLYDECVQKGLPFDLIYRIVRPNGDTRYVHSNAQPFIDKNGRTSKVFGIIQDVTEMKHVELALQESEERYRTLFENSPIAIWEEDFSAVQDFFDKMRETGIEDFRNYFEKNPEEIFRLAELVEIKNVNETSVRFFDASSKDDFPQKLAHYTIDNVFEVLREEFIALAEGQANFNSEIVVEDLAGRTRTFSLDLAVAPAYKRKLDRVLVSFIDISERKQAEEIMLARYRLVRRSMTELLPDLLQATLDEIEELTGSSVGFFHIVGADQNNLSLQAWSTNTLHKECSAGGEGVYHHPLDEAGVWVDCVRERKPIIHNDYKSLEHRKGFPDGHVNITRELIVPIIRGENIVAVIGVGNKEIEYTRKDVETVSLLTDLAWDIVERKQTEAALRESEALYHDLVETAQDLIWQCDREGKYIYLNPAWEDVFGYKVEKMLGKTFTDFQEPDYAERDLAVYENILEGQSVNNFETVHLGKDGRKIHLVFNAKTVRDEQGNILGTRGTAYDITDRKRAEEALLRSEYLLRESQKLASMGHYILDIPSGNWESSNSLNKLFGIDWDYKTDVNGWLQIIHPEDREDMAVYLAEEVVKECRNFDREYRIVRVSSGETRWMHGLGRLEFDGAGNPIRLLGNIQDITERKKADLALRESADRYRAVVDNQTEFIVRWKPDGTRTFVNDAYLRYYDISMEEALSSSFKSLIVEEDRPVVEAKIARLMSGQTHSETDVHRVLRPDGSIGWQEWTDNALFDEQGNIFEFQSVGRDITEQKQAELARQESERRFREILENVQLLALSTDREGAITFCNDYLLELIGWKREELLGKNWFTTCLPPDVGPAVQAMFKETLEGENVPSYYENEIQTKASERRLIVWNNTMLRDIEGQVIGTSSIGEDITERKYAENALRAKTRELEALFSISSHLRSAQSADEMLPVVLAEIQRVLRSDANAVILLNPDEERFTYAISDGPLKVNTGDQFNVEKSISGLVLQTRQPYITEDLSSDPNKTTSLQGEDTLGPTMFAPVISESEFIGVLLCARAKGDDARQFGESDVQLLTAIGEMVGNALRRARLYDQALTRLKHVQTLHSIDMAISANLDLAVILEVLLTQGAAQLDVDAASILLLNPHTHMLEFAAGNGFQAKRMKAASLRLGEGLPGQAAMDRKVLHIRDLSESDSLVRKHLLDEGFVSYQAAPLIAKGQLQGVLEIFNRNPIDVGEEKIGFLETLATQAAIAIDNSRLFSDLQRSNFELEMAYDATIEGWSRALELRDQETEGHTLRVTDMTLELAQAMGVRSGELTHIRRGALLHDIGKMGVPDRILLKPGKLTADEWEVMKQHADYAFEMLWPIEFLRPAIDIPHCHHERWDGTGYPRKLKGEQIPLSARVFAVVDVWDAVTNDRPYRKAWTNEEALEYITTNSGQHFDPRVVEKFLELLGNNGYM